MKHEGFEICQSIRLDNLIFQVADAQGTGRLGRARFGNQDLAHRAWAVGHSFHPRHQVGQVVLQVPRLCCLADPICSHRLRAVQLVEAFFEGRHLKMMHETLKSLLRVPR